MKLPRLKYEQIISFWLLSAYLLGNFALPVFEGVHWLSHLADDAPPHSFYNHQTNHSHQVLTNISELFNGHSEKPVTPASQQVLKKIPLLLMEQEVFIEWLTISYRGKYSFQSNASSTPFLPIVIPPPQV